MPERAEFIIELELDTLEEMANIFRRLDVEFEPVENMVRLYRDGRRDNVLIGKDMGKILRECNVRLREIGESRRFREEFREMPPATRRDLEEFQQKHLEALKPED